MQAGGAAGLLAYLRTGSRDERLFLLQAASALNMIEGQNSERRDRNLAALISKALAGEGV